MTSVRAATSIDEVAELWKSLVRHHYAVGSAISQAGEPIGPEQSWLARRRQYEAWSREPGWLLLVAERDGEVAGYAAARITPSASAWDFGDRVGRLETLTVAPAARSHGLGTVLVTEVRRHWRDCGIRAATVTVIAGNDDALRFYERLGAVDFSRTAVFPI
ncbi:hypothetical protein Ade02nite_23890 [Paractinoplanes deccanensis]|uniref:N-acetyltransferase domain-containing protein n=1 Tax=Paractinoplanes deccanensis TaxID=113561 RepID=A0ABQ3Y169_9ACTN|nr:GNAT family N-acetyltransferase [Actinoplanes deccanensis]GID73748.1 hypothetical protein Ade02nite_23890 [Actinoplanes deccanensis]